MIKCHPLLSHLQAIDGRVGLYHQLLKVYGSLSLITAHTVATRQGESGGEDGEEEDGGGSLLPEPERLGCESDGPPGLGLGVDFIDA